MFQESLKRLVESSIFVNAPFMLSFDKSTNIILLKIRKKDYSNDHDMSSKVRSKETQKRQFHLYNKDIFGAHASSSRHLILLDILDSSARCQYLVHGYDITMGISCYHGYGSGCKEVNKEHQFKANIYNITQIRLQRFQGYFNLQYIISIHFINFINTLY